MEKITWKEARELALQQLKDAEQRRIKLAELEALEFTVLPELAAEIRARHDYREKTKNVSIGSF